MEKSSKPIIILAGNYHQYLDHVQSHRDGARFVFGDRVEKLMGIEARGVLVVGTFWSNPNSLPLYQFAKSRIR